MTPGTSNGATLAKVLGARSTIALEHDPTAVKIHKREGVDIAIDPREVTAEKMVRFAHDPRIRQVGLLEDHRFEVVDLSVRAGSMFADKAFRDLPTSGIIGAVSRDDKTLFAHGSGPAIGSSCS